MAVWTHNLPSGHLKRNDSREVDEGIFQGVERPCEQIISLLGVKKSDFDEVV
jgi:hypothetical protein